MIFNSIAKVEGLRAFSQFKAGLTLGNTAVLSFWSGPILSALELQDLLNAHRAPDLSFSGLWGSTYMNSIGRIELVRLVNTNVASFAMIGQDGARIDMAKSSTSVVSLGTISSFTLAFCGPSFTDYTDAPGNRCISLISGSAGLADSGSDLSLNKLSVASTDDFPAVNDISILFNLPLLFSDELLGGV